MECGPVVPDVGSDWLEKGVIAGFRVWQLMFMSGAGATVIIVVMCCFMKCRVPRTKQEIEADCHRRELTIQFRRQLNKLPIEDLSFLKSLEKVREVFEHEEERRKRGSWDSLLEDGQELTVKRKLRKLMRVFRFKKKKKGDDAEEGNGNSEEVKDNVKEENGIKKQNSDDRKHTEKAKKQVEIDVEPRNHTSA